MSDLLSSIKPYLSVDTLDDLNSIDLYYNSEIFDTFVERILNSFFSKDSIRGLYIILNELDDKKLGYTNNFIKKTSKLSELKFNIKKEISSSLIEHYQNNTNSDLSLYQDIEISLLNKIDSFFEKEITDDNILLNTYNILYNITSDLINHISLSLEDLYFLKVSNDYE